jgi:hypothetical protein
VFLVFPDRFGFFPSCNVALLIVILLAKKMNTDSPQKKPFGRREWLLLIALLVLTQFLIHALAWRFGGSSNALGYVSFAGTVVSTILAVLAIIYGFLQSAEQSQSTTTIASQITSLQRVVESFQKSGGMLSQQLQQLAEVSSGINRAIAVSESSQQQISKVQSSLDEVRELFASGATASTEKVGVRSLPETAVLTTPEAIREFLNRLNTIPGVAAYAVVVAIGKGDRTLKSIQKGYFTALYAEIVHPDGTMSKVIENFLDGYFSGVFRALPFYMWDKDGVIEVLPEFASQLRAVMGRVKFGNSESDWRKILDRLIAIDEQREVLPSKPTPSDPKE